MLRKIVHTYFTRLLATGLVFVAVVLTSKFLGADGKGVTSIFTTDVLFINLFNELIGGVSIIFLAPRMRLLNLLLPSVLFIFLNSVVMSVVFYSEGIIAGELAVHLCIVAVLQSLANLVLYVALGKEQITRHNYLFLLKAFINTAMLAAFFMWLDQRTVMSFIYALYTSNLVLLVFGLPWVISQMLPLRDLKNIWQTTRTLASYSGIAQLANIVQTLNYRLSFYLLSFFIDKSAVGIYSIGLALCDVVWLLTKSIGTVQLTKISNARSGENTRLLTEKYVGYGMVSTVALLTPLLLVPETFYLFVFGEDFGGIKDVMFAMSWGILIFSINIILANYFAGTGRFAVNLKASAFGLVSATAANLLLIPRLGIIGAALAASITYTAITLFTAWKFWKDDATGWKNIFPGKKDVRKALVLLGFSRNSA